jgi:hypothetical protein
MLGSQLVEGETVHACGSGVALAAGSMIVSSSSAGAVAQRVQGVDGSRITVVGMFDALSFAAADDGFNALIARANKSIVRLAHARDVGSG